MPEEEVLVESNSFFLTQSSWIVLKLCVVLFAGVLGSAKVEYHGLVRILHRCRGDGA